MSTLVERGVRTIRYAGIGDEAASTVDGQLAALAALGWDAIELRTVGGIPIAELDDAVFEQLAERLLAENVTVVGVASGIGNWGRPITGDFGRDVAELAVLARRCRALGTRYVRVMSYPNAGLAEPDWAGRVIERMRELAARAEAAGLVLLHENCAGWAAADATRILRLLDAVASPALRLLFDIGNGVAHGYDGYALLTQVVDYVDHVHVKDARPGPVYTVPGSGVARVADCVELLLRNGYAGALAIEPHLSVRPHEGSVAGAEPSGFIAAGTALERLVRNDILPGLPCWRSVPGGLRSR